MNLHKIIFIVEEIAFLFLGILLILAGTSISSNGIMYGNVMMYAGIMAIILAFVLSFLYLYNKKKSGKLWGRSH
ncbi:MULTISPECIES: hypothetical protein [Ferroplasma]|uniref:hypothetical protein n=1 Tax=Ferroplasma TaxID=74968 RepID=UPI0023F23EEC|nr:MULTISPECIES: hypothetical protein [Ferroplasma]